MKDNINLSKVKVVRDSVARMCGAVLVLGRKHLILVIVFLILFFKLHNLLRESVELAHLQRNLFTRACDCVCACVRREHHVKGTRGKVKKSPLKA